MCVRARARVGEGNARGRAYFVTRTASLVSRRDSTAHASLIIVGMAGFEDPVRWEVAAQTRTLLSSNASLLDAVASSKFIGGGRRPIRMGAFATDSAATPHDDGSSRIIHNSQAGGLESTGSSGFPSGALASSEHVRGCRKQNHIHIERKGRAR